MLRSSWEDCRSTFSRAEKDDYIYIYIKKRGSHLGFFLYINLIMLFKIQPFFGRQPEEHNKGFKHISCLTAYKSLMWFFGSNYLCLCKQSSLKLSKLINLHDITSNTIFFFCGCSSCKKSFTPLHESKWYRSFCLNQQALEKHVEYRWLHLICSSVEHKLCSSWWQTYELKLRHLCKLLNLVGFSFSRTSQF